MARRLLFDGQASLRSTFLSAYEHSDHNVANICFSESSIGIDFALIKEKIVAAMPKAGRPVGGE